MFKFGIVNDQNYLRRNSLFGRERKIAIPFLINLLKDNPSNKKAQKFLWEIKLGNTYKTTREGRLRNIDQALCTTIKEEFNHKENLIIYDLAASIGITSLELFEMLIENGMKNINFTATDYFTHIYIVRDKKYGITCVFDVDLKYVQFICSKFVLSNPESAFDFGNIALLKVFERYYYKYAKKTLEALKLNPYDYSETETHVGRYVISRHPLIDSRVLKKIENSKKFNFIHHDIFTKLNINIDIIRAMNILNLSYFSADMIKLAVSLIHQSLTNGGLLLIGREDNNDENMCNATLFRKVGNHFQTVFHIGKGTEVKDIVLSHK